MERDVILREVGLRDGLQMVKSQFPTEAKKQWISAAVAAGMPEIEVCSFVPPHVVPQFSDHAEVVAHARTLADLTVSALVPNAKGAERGFPLGVDKLNFVRSASERDVPAVAALLAEAWRAHERMEAGNHIGKIVLDIG